LVSGLAYPDSVPGRIVQAWKQGGLELVLSRYILDELLRVLPRLNHRLKWQPGDFADLVDILALEAELVEPQSKDKGLPRDVNDVLVLGTFLAAKAEYLVTGDNDLLALAEHYPIISPADFWRRHGG
jgi:putative PIN family toxin of toxin-antitoxin system